MRRALAVTVLFSIALVLAPSAHAFLSVVSQDNRNLTFTLTTIEARVGFIDLDGDDQPDVAGPDEPFYLDLGGGLTVSWGDVRLTAASAYRPGSVVNATNWDMGHKLKEASGWFSTDPAGSWYFDTDASRRVSEGDLYLSGNRAGTKVATGDSAIGTTLAVIQQAVVQSDRAGYLDVNNNGKRDPTELIFLDVDKDQEVSREDVQLRPTGLSTDGAPPVTPPTGPELATDEEVEALRQKVNALEERLELVSERVETLEQGGGPANGAGMNGATESPVGLALALGALALAAGAALVVRRRR